jgi:glycosidase
MSYINESVIYNIYPLGFCGAPRENDFKQEYRLDKIYDCIDHFKKLSVNALVFNPLFESTRHGYDTIDYRKVDCRLGDNNSFKAICKALHDNNIKILLDGVFNHVGRDFFAFKDVQEKKWDSQYCSWFQGLNFDGTSPYGDPFWYEGWGGHYDLVKLNLHNPEVVDYLLGSVNFWIDEFDIDGLRLDAADCVDLEFFKRLRHTCKSKKPDFWLYGEIIHGDYNRWANNETLDSVTNYELYKGIYSSHNDHNYFEIAHSLNRQFANGGIYQNIYTYNFVDNHDVNRIASSLKDKNHLKNVYTLLYTIPGVPSIYYGSEFGIEGERTKSSDYELRPCLDLGNVENANYDLFNHLVKLGKIRLALEALKYGKFQNVNIMNEKLVYKRWTDNQTVFVAFNLTNHEEKIGFDTGCNAKLTDVLNNNEVFDVNGYYEISMQPYSTRILVVNDGSFKLDFDSAEADKATSANDSCAQSQTKSADNAENEPQQSPQPKVALGRYRHFKGGEYEVIGFATHTETEEKLVIYISLYDNNKVWARPYDMFTEYVEVDGRQVPRFTPINN